MMRITGKARHGDLVYLSNSKRLSRTRKGEVRQNMEIPRLEYQSFDADIPG
jgi:hypothetical protein